MAYYDVTPEVFEEQGWKYWDEEKPQKGDKCEVGLMIRSPLGRTEKTIMGFDWTGANWEFDGEIFKLEYQRETVEDEDKDWVAYYKRSMKTKVDIKSEIDPRLKTKNMQGDLVWRYQKNG